MKKLTLALLITFSLAWLAPADAQLFSRKPKTPPAQRLGELIVQVKTDADEGKRAAAAEELREFDVKKFPEIVPVLIDVARHDKKASVRHDALDSLAKIRPVSQGAGQMLEWAAQHDDAWRNRWLAKSALMRYQWAGYHAPKNEAKGPPALTTQEPPLLDSQRPPSKPGTLTRMMPTKTSSQPKNQPRVVNQPTPPPVIVTQPAPAVVTQPLPPVVESTGRAAATSTPPPIIVDAPASVIAPALKGPAPAIPVVDPSPNVVSPNFRPAGVSPPRIVPSTPPPAKTEDRGPILTPPM